MQFTQTQLQQFPVHLVENVQFLAKKIKNEDVLQEAIANLLSGQPIEKAEKNARCDTWRNSYQPAGWFSLEGLEIEKKEKEEVEIATKIRLANDSAECLLSLVGKGTEAIGHELKIGQRRAQQKLKKLIDDLENPTPQADLFWGEKQ